MERGANVEAWLVVARLLPLPRRRQRAGGGGGVGDQRVQMGLDRGIAGGQLALIRLEEFEVLLQDEDVLRAVMAGERGGDLRLGGLAPGVPMLGERLRIGPPGDDVTDNAQPGDAAEIAEHGRELEVHLQQRLLHALDMCGGALHQGLAVAQIRAQGGDGGGGAETAAQQADAVQLLDPLAVHDVALPPRDVLHVMRVDEHHLEAPGLEDLVEGDPVHPGRFHRDGGDAAGREPVGAAMEFGRDGRERPHRGRVPVGGDGDVVLGRPAIDPRGVRVHALEECGAGCRLLAMTRLMALHGMLLLDRVRRSIRGQGMRRRGILLNGITRRRACHHCRRRGIPQTRLGDGLTRSTIGLVGHGPGGSRHYTQPFVADQFLDCSLMTPSCDGLGSAPGNPGRSSLPDSLRA